MPTVQTVHFLVHRRPLFRTLASSRLHLLLVVVCIGSTLPPPSLAQEPHRDWLRSRTVVAIDSGSAPVAAITSGWSVFVSVFWCRPAGNRQRPSLPMAL